MIVFWSLAALMAAGAASLVLLLAVRGRTAVGEGSEVALYRRQLAEVDDLRERNLLDDAGHAAARAEAGRRLLAAGEQTLGTSPPRQSRPLLLAVVVAAPLLAVGLYSLVGLEGTADQPYAQRLTQWRASDPAALDPPELAAVAQDVADRHADDPNAWRFLGRARLQAGEAFAAVRALERAAELGGTANDYIALGEALTTFNEGRVGEGAATAFAEALKRDPASIPARYGAALGKLQAGDVEGGRAALAALAVALPPGDPRRAALQAELAKAPAARN